MSKCYDIDETPAKLRGMLERLTLAVEQANNLQHAGLKVTAHKWAELYQLTGEARNLLAEKQA